MTRETIANAFDVVCATVDSFALRDKLSRGIFNAVVMLIWLISILLAVRRF